MPNAARLEAGARRFALTLGRTLELSLLTAHAQWCIDHGQGTRLAAAARRFVMNGVDQINDALHASMDKRDLSGVIVPN